MTYFLELKRNWFNGQENLHAKHGNAVLRHPVDDLAVAPKDAKVFDEAGKELGLVSDLLAKPTPVPAAPKAPPAKTEEELEKELADAEADLEKAEKELADASTAAAKTKANSAVEVAKKKVEAAEAALKE